MAGDLVRLTFVPQIVILRVWGEWNPGARRVEACGGDPGSPGVTLPQGQKRFQIRAREPDFVIIIDII